MLVVNYTESEDDLMSSEAELENDDCLGEGYVDSDLQDMERSVTSKG